MNALRTLTGRSQPRVVVFRTCLLFLREDGQLLSVSVYYDSTLDGRRYRPYFEHVATPGPVRDLLKQGKYAYVVLEDGTVHYADYHVSGSHDASSEWRRRAYPEPVVELVPFWINGGPYVRTETGRVLLCEKDGTLAVTAVAAPVSMLAPGDGRVTGLTRDGRLLTLDFHVPARTYQAAALNVPAPLAAVCHAGMYNYALTTTQRLFYGEHAESPAFPPPIMRPAVFYEPGARAGQVPPHRLIRVTRIITGGRYPLFLTDEGHAYLDYFAASIFLLPDAYDSEIVRNEHGWTRSTGVLARIPLPGPVRDAVVAGTHAVFLLTYGEVYVLGSRQGERLGVPVVDRSGNTGTLRTACQLRLPYRVRALAGNGTVTFLQSRDGTWHYTGIRHAIMRTSLDADQQCSIPSHAGEMPWPTVERAGHTFYPVVVR